MSSKTSGFVATNVPTSVVLSLQMLKCRPKNWPWAWLTSRLTGTPTPAPPSSQMSAHTHVPDTIGAVAMLIWYVFHTQI